MPALKYKVELNESERTHLKQMASRGETSARKVKRALVLLKADEGLIDRDIASGLPWLTARFRSRLAVTSERLCASRRLGASAATHRERWTP